MTPAAYRDLRRVARRFSRRADEIDDLVQEALLEGVRHGRANDTRWLAGVVRLRAAHLARSAARRIRRDTDYAADHARASPDPTPARPGAAPADLPPLPPSLRVVALLALTGHSRDDIRRLLVITDSALRQRVTALRRHIRAAGGAVPSDFLGLRFDLPHGRIRRDLATLLTRGPGRLATHDPDGHFLVLVPSRPHETPGGGNGGAVALPAAATEGNQ